MKQWLELLQYGKMAEVQTICIPFADYFGEELFNPVWFVFVECIGVSSRKR